MENQSTEANEAQKRQEKEDKLFRIGVILDFNTAFIWRNVVQTDKPVFQPCVSGDFTGIENFRFGFCYWQGWDLSSDRRDIYHRRLNESDYSIRAGCTAWQTEDAATSLDLEFGHEWYTYHFERREGGSSLSPSTREFYLKASFTNPIVGVYGQVSWLYDKIQDMDTGFYYELGLKKEFDLASVLAVKEETLALGLDWNTSFGDKDYNYFMTGCSEGGFLGTTAKIYLTWNITDLISLMGTFAYGTSELRRPPRLRRIGLRRRQGCPLGRLPPVLQLLRFG